MSENANQNDHQADAVQVLKATIQAAPQTAGVYFFANERGYPLYIGKSVNIRQRLLSHCYAIQRDPGEEKLFLQTHSITWQQTAGELGALLLEAYLIKQKQPLFNKRLRRQRRLVTVAIETTPYVRFDIIKFDLKAIKGQVFGLFKSRHQAIEQLRKLCKTHQLCDYSLTGFPKAPRPCFSRQLKQCSGACERIIDPKEYHQEVVSVLTALSVLSWPYPGKIAIREASDDLTHYHVIDNWVYLQTNPSPVYDPNQDLNEQLSFDKDYYLTLNRFLRESDPSDIIQL